MARQKATIKQSDFSRGATRPELLEADDDALRQRSYQTGRNVRPAGQRGLMRRYGTLGINSFTNATPLEAAQYEVEPEAGEVYYLIFTDGGLLIYDDEGNHDATFGSMPWSDTPWVAKAGENTYIGGDHPIYVLNYDAGTWALAALDFYESPGGAISQPLYNFEQGLRLRPSDVTGSITLRAESAFFTAAYVGTRIRWHDKEMEITGYTSTLEVTADVVDRLPPTHDVTVTATHLFAIGEVVVGADSGYNGYISDIDHGTNKITVVSLSGQDGVDVGEKLIGPNAKSEVTARTTVSPHYSPYWTEPVISVKRGYPRAGAVVNGRLFLTDFAETPNMVCASSVRALNDFETGLEDDDAIIRRIGDEGKRVRHAINAGDVIFLTDGGSYYVNARDGQEITPSNFMAVKFDSRACGSCPPIFVDNAVFYTSATDILVAMLTGNVYLNWSVTVASDGYEGQFSRIASFAVPGKFFSNDERSILAITEDGDIVSIHHNTLAGDLGMFVWDFWGDGALRGDDEAIVLGAAPIGGQFWLMVARRPSAAGSWTYVIEELNPNMPLDWVTQKTGGTTVNLVAYDGYSVSLMHGDRYLGTFDDYEAAEAYIDAYPEAVTISVGLAWVPEFSPWDFEQIQSGRNGMIRARTIRVGVSVRNTTSFYVRANTTTRRVGPFEVGDDITGNPPSKTEVFKFSVFGNRDHPDIAIGQDIPGTFEVLAYIAEVQA